MDMDFNVPMNPQFRCGECINVDGAKCKVNCQL